MVIARILKERGYLVDTAVNGLQAVEMCSKNSYDAILMDIQMPDMFLKYLKNQYYQEEKDLKILIAEDDMISRRFLLKFLSEYGECDVVIDGMEALDAYLISVKETEPYDLICLDIMMPKVDGIKVLKAIRDFEKQRRIMPDKKAKIIMITALADTEHFHKAFELGCEAYATKPIDMDKLIGVMKDLDIIKK